MKYCRRSLSWSASKERRGAVRGQTPAESDFVRRAKFDKPTAEHAEFLNANSARRPTTAAWRASLRPPSPFHLALIPVLFLVERRISRSFSCFASSGSWGFFTRCFCLDGLQGKDTFDCVSLLSCRCCCACSSNVLSRQRRGWRLFYY